MYSEVKYLWCPQDLRKATGLGSISYRAVMGRLADESVAPVLVTTAAQVQLRDLLPRIQQRHAKLVGADGREIGLSEPSETCSRSFWKI